MGQGSAAADGCDGLMKMMGWMGRLDVLSTEGVMAEK
jgi:hypothetical protein